MMSHWIMGILAAAYGLMGVLMGAAARDTCIFIFGLSLFAAAVLFVRWMIKAAYDEADNDVSAA